MYKEFNSTKEKSQTNPTQGMKITSFSFTIDQRNKRGDSLSARVYLFDTFQMILYLEHDLFVDQQCRDVQLCSHESADEFLLISSSDRCACPKKSAIFCRDDHQSCAQRCHSESKILLKQNSQSKQILINNSPISLALLDKDILENNVEMIYLAHRNNIPKCLLEHTKNRLNPIEEPTITFSTRQVSAEKSFISRSRAFLLFRK